MGHVQGGIHKLQMFGRETCIVFSKHIRPKRSRNARLGHSKIVTEMTKTCESDIRLHMKLSM